MKSALGRAIDIRFASNRFAIFATVAAGTVGLVVTLVRDNGNAFGAGFLAGGAAFLAWAIARELDPDHALSAYAAAPLGLVMWFFDPAGLLVTGAVLLAIRVVAGTTGYSPSHFDLVVLVGYAAVVGLRPGGIVAAAAIGVAIAVDARLAGRDSALRYGSALASIVGASVATALWASPIEFSSITVASGAAAAVAVGIAIAIPVGPVTSVTDLKKQPLEARRVRMGRLLAALVIVGYLGLGGSNGVTEMGAVVAAVVALFAAAVYTSSGRPIPTSTPGG